MIDAADSEGSINTQRWCVCPTFSVLSHQENVCEALMALASTHSSDLDSQLWPRLAAPQPAALASTRSSDLDQQLWPGPAALTSTRSSGLDQQLWPGPAALTSTRSSGLDSQLSDSQLWPRLTALASTHSSDLLGPFFYAHVKS
ncbi:uncharacterized protein V6R79_008772 [Siganus canaliculatus]